MKRRGGTRRDGRDRDAAKSFSGHVGFRAGDFGGVRIFEPAASDRAGEIYFVVVVFIFGGGYRDWLGDVSGIALRVYKSGREINAEKRSARRSAARKNFPDKNLHNWRLLNVAEMMLSTSSDAKE